MFKKNRALNTLNISCDATKLWQGCILGSIAHAIMVATYPDFSFEQSWDGDNYSVQDGCGQRGTVSFSKGYCVALFRNENCSRISRPKKASTFLKNAPIEVMELAEKEALQYMLEEIPGETKPVITAAFWGREQLYSVDSIQTLNDCGMLLLSRQLEGYDEAVNAWSDYYSMDSEQLSLMEYLYSEKVCVPTISLVLPGAKRQVLSYVSDEGKIESDKRLAELQIFWNDIS